MGRIIPDGDPLAQILRELLQQSNTMANYRVTVETAGRIYAERLGHFLRTQPTDPAPAPVQVLGGGELPADVRRGLGIQDPPAWDPDAEAVRAIREAWNISATFQDLLPALMRAAVEAAGERQDRGRRG